MLPKLIINYKAYPHALGEKGVAISRAVASFSQELGVKAAVAPLSVDLRENSKVVETLAQHVDGVTMGSHTGHLPPEAAKEAGAKGTLLNHSERRLPMPELEKAVNRAKEVGLYVVSCAATPEEAEEISKLNVDAVAFEPPSLIGSGRAVSKEKPEEIKRAVELVDKPLYVGAGITSGEDVKASLELGAYGILVASAVVKAEKPDEKARELLEAFLRD